MSTSKATIQIQAKWELAALAPMFASCVATRLPWRRHQDDDRLTEADSVVFQHLHGALFVVSVPMLYEKRPYYTPTVDEILATAGSVTPYDHAMMSE